ncbi:TPA: SDR family oxidoreductase [Methanopyrus kandleri]|uniref:Nucleoside-diphosphate-sugar epimerase n=2 Tax=Methanopyrus kandleri TaxID=2320 RepID=Q8TXF0_METKA|nr:Nucleoside-diphosphate-sugar epimerase [Methanopyrus kandleri AV19]HII70049.1 SDR family oxidoreductase [Methanopyrus kandleri]
MILVTGGAGFIGSHVVEELVDRGHDVVVLDNFSVGCEENLREVRDDIEIVRADVTDPRAVERTFREYRPEAVIHLAAQVNVRYSMESPFVDARINALGTLNLVSLAAEHDVERFVYASSGGAVYGEPEYLPVDEEHPTRPISNYGVSKLAGEYYVRVYAERDGFEYVILRYANVYGPRQDPRGEAGVIPIFLLRAARGEPLTIFGDGEQTRDFVFVEDVARVTAEAVERGDGVYNIGTGRETSVNDIVNAVKAVTGVDVEVVYEDPRPGEVRRIYLDPSRAREELGFEPRVDLEEGIERTWEWIRRKIA